MKSIITVEKNPVKVVEKTRFLDLSLSHILLSSNYGKRLHSSNQLQHVRLNDLEESIGIVDMYPMPRLL